MCDCDKKCEKEDCCEEQKEKEAKEKCKKDKRKLEPYVESDGFFNIDDFQKNK